MYYDVIVKINVRYARSYPLHTKKGSDTINLASHALIQNKIKGVWIWWLNNTVGLLFEQTKNES